MSHTDLVAVFKDRGCRPHQAEFAAAFLADGSERVHVLESGPGFGKGFVAGSLCAYAASTGLARRILVLTRAALTAQWCDIVTRGAPGVPVIAVDRRRLRELESGVAVGESPWPANAIVIMSIDLAKKEDVVERLTGDEWDLLVVDEAPLGMTGTLRHRLLTALLEQFPDMRMLVLRMCLPSSVADESSDTEELLANAAVTRWNRSSVMGWDREPLLPELQFQMIQYESHADESALLTCLREQVQRYSAEHPANRMMASSLLQTASSSVFALEQRLNRMRLRRDEIAREMADLEEEFGLFEEPPDLDDIQQPTIAVLGVEELRGAQPFSPDVVTDLLEMLEALEVDSKLEALIGLLADIGAGASQQNRVCVFTSYVDTATYLESSLEETVPRVFAMTGRQSYEERNSIFQEFSENGGLLVATDVVLVGCDFRNVDTGFFYDIPPNRVALQVRLGRFLRFGRRAPVHLFAFADASDSLLIGRSQAESMQQLLATGDE